MARLQAYVVIRIEKLLCAGGIYGHMYVWRRDILDMQKYFCSNKSISTSFGWLSNGERIKAEKFVIETENQFKRKQEKPGKLQENR